MVNPSISKKIIQERNIVIINYPISISNEKRKKEISHSSDPTI